MRLTVRSPSVIVPAALAVILLMTLKLHRRLYLFPRPPP
jgi:hypothetical protein